MSQFFRLPGDDPQADNTVRPGELITKSNSLRPNMLALGGVAATPWRVAEAESALVGKPADTESFRVAAELVMAGATPLSQNAFKVDLGKHSVVRALRQASALQR